MTSSLSQATAGLPSCVTFSKGLKCWSWILNYVSKTCFLSLRNRPWSYLLTLFSDSMRLAIQVHFAFTNHSIGGLHSVALVLCKSSADWLLQICPYGSLQRLKVSYHVFTSFITGLVQTPAGRVIFLYYHGQDSSSSGPTRQLEVCRGWRGKRRLLFYMKSAASTQWFNDLMHVCDTQWQHYWMETVIYIVVHHIYAYISDINVFVL